MTTSTNPSLDEIASSVFTLPGLPYAIVSWIEPNASDSSGYVSLVFNGPGRNGGNYNIGEYNVTYTATDGSGNSVICFFSITITDMESPNISCPADITQSTDPGLYSANVTWSDPYVTDNSGVFTVTSTSSSGNLESPNISCPADITQSTDPGEFSANVTWSDPYVTDNSGVFTITSTSSSGSTFPAGNTTISITAEDSSGNEATCNFTVTVVDLESPNISCPADITQSTDPGLYSANVTWSDPYVTDNSGVFTITSTSSSGSAFPAGYTSVSITAEDSNLESPNISCPADITQSTDPGLFSANVTWSDPYVTDNSGFFTVTSTSSSGSVFPAGNITVSITAEDLSGNEATCNFTITVIDLESPNISCPADITQPTDPGLFSANVTWSDPYVTDNSGVFTISSTASSGNLESPNISCPADITQSTDPGLYSAKVTWSDPYVTDNSGVFTITPTASSGNLESPNITCPADITQSTDPGVNSARVNWPDPYVIDNSGLFTITLTASSGNLESPNISCPADITQPTDQGQFSTNVTCIFPAGNTTVYFTAEDSSGNEATCNFTVLYFFVGKCFSSREYHTGNTTVHFTAEDSSGNEATCNFTVQYSSTSSSGSVFPAGNTTVSITAEDLSGNDATCNFTITVVDRESPIITCPKDIRKRQRPNSAFVNVTWPNPVVVDNSGSFSPPVSVPGSGSLFGVGNTTVNVSSQDASGNVGSCQFVITVLDLDECGNASYYCHENAQCINSKGNFTCRCNAGFEDLDPSYPGRLCEDVTLPNITGCPDSQSVPTLPGLPYAIVSWIEPNASDSSGYVSLVFNGPGRNGGTYNIGEYNVMYTATDGSGNAVICSFSITIIDRESPIITCPKDIRKRQRPNSAFVNVTWPNPVVVDNSGSFSPPVSVPGSGSLFGVGNTTVNVSSQDASGNVGSCQFVITVLDLDECANASYYCHENAQCINSKGNFTCRCNAGFEDLDPSYPGRLCEDVTLPNITGCPDSQSVPTLPGLPYAIVSWIEPNASDSSGYVSLVFNGPGRSGGTYNIGEYNVTYTAKDGSGNAVICSFSITIIDRESPNITCPEDIREVQEHGSFTVNVSWPTPLVADNSGSFTPPRSEPESGSLFAIGQTMVVVTSSDQNGNTGHCQFTVTIEDFNECSNASHDCHDNARCINAQGNFTCECNDGYTDLRPSHPGRLCEASQSKPTLPGLPFALFSWIEPNASDTSMAVTLVFNGPGENGGRYNISDYNVTYTAIDSAGNTAVCLFEIIVRDEEFPNITCPADITQSTDAGLYSADVSWPDTQIIDNSGSVSIQANYTSGDMFPVGNTTVVIAVEDESGNEVICIFVITITGDKFKLFTTL
ncbi:hyalin-like [Diadema antillarum]|uniref:hyalin-like n=1 Tax=Diadema antillarum TaxID=105358 RepID=UPI003A88CA89